MTRMSTFCAVWSGVIAAVSWRLAVLGTLANCVGSVRRTVGAITRDCQRRRSGANRTLGYQPAKASMTYTAPRATKAAERISSSRIRSGGASL